MEEKFNSFYLSERSLYFYKDELKFEVKQPSIDIQFENNQIQNIIIKGLIDINQWNELEKEGLFNFHANGNNLSTFEEGKDIVIQLFYAHSLLSSVHSATAEEWLQMIENNVSKKYLNTDNWFIEKALQTIQSPEGISGELKIGYRSKWRSNKTNNKSSKLIEDVFAFFRSAFPEIKMDDSGASFRWNLSSEIPNSLAEVIIKERFQQVIFYVHLPFNIEPNSMHKLVNEINFGLPVGNFEYLEEPPNLRFKTSVEYHKMELTYTMLQNLYQSNLSVASKYHDRFIEI